MTSGGKKDPTYIDDVFSTYLWKGDGLVGRAIGNGIKLSNNNAGSSVHFDGNGDYLSIPESSAWDIGTNYTAECFFYINQIVGNGWDAIFGQWPGSNNASTNTWVLEYVGASTLYFYYNDGSQSMQNVSLGNVSLGAWHHFAFSKEGSNTRLFIDGNLTQTITPTYYDGNGSFNIGGNVAGGGWINGHVSNVRITTGQALYTSNFTPTTEALTTTSQGAIESNVKLLCCQSSTSATAATKSPTTITANGNAQAQAFGPFTTTDGEGGLVWIKSRSTGNVNVWFDTVRGANQRLRSDSNLAQSNADTLQPLFTNSGFTVGSGNEVNGAGNQYASWTWRKQKGFFDIVEFTGNGTSSQVIPHNLGSVPGCIMLKAKNVADNWKVYHRGLNGGDTPEKWLIKLNDTQAASEYTEWWNDTAPTATNFTVGEWNNGSGWDFVAYVFAGGPSTAATARSVDFDGSDDQLNIADNTDFELGNGDFTLETWVKSTQTTSSYKTAIAKWVDSGSNRSWMIRYSSQDIGTGWSFFYSLDGWNYSGSNGGTLMGSDISDGHWHHIAVTRTGGKIRTFTDGILNTTVSETGTFYDGSGAVTIGGQSGNYFDGQLSNVRLVKGTALYTGRFAPPLAPLTNVTNTKLLCCNNSSVTGSTVTPGTITASSSPTASTDSPFDDPEGFKFGEGGDQNLIKCGSYVGNSTANHEMEIGWEPQWWLVKNITSGNTNWQLLDSMRGWVIEANDQYFAPNNVSAESAFNFGNPTSTGFNMSNASSNWQNADGNTYIYIAIRRPDGYVGKPPEAGTNVLSIATGYPDNASAGKANFTSGFVTDYLFWKQYQSSSSWYTAARLMGKRYLIPNDHNSEATNSNYEFSYNDGFYVGPYTITNQMAWSFKRHAGFDVVLDKGNGQATKTNPHGLGVVPEMIWRKNRDGGSDNWQVYHVGLNGGTNPHLYRLYLDTGSAEMSDQWTWDSAPTDKHFTVGSNGAVNRNGDDFITMLFASVEGISKVGYYTGTGASGNTITLGFQPRFVIIKNNSRSSTSWVVLDTVRGWTSGNDQSIELNETNAPETYNYGEPTSNGFTLDETGNWTNRANDNYIYYAHA